MTLDELIAEIEKAIEIDDDRAQLAALQALRADAGQVVARVSPPDRESMRSALTRGRGGDALQILRGLRGRVAA